MQEFSLKETRASAALRRFLWGAGCLVFGAMSAGAEIAQPASAPLNAAAGPAAGAPLFTPVDPVASKLDYVLKADAQHPLARLYFSCFTGAAAGDIDGDGAVDLFFSHGPGPNRIYRQRGPFVFEDISEAAGIHGGTAWGNGATMTDIDGDGDLDIFVCNYDAPNHLFVNDGKGRFTESAGATGLGVVDACIMAAFCDYDRDGDLDAYLVTNRYFHAGGRPAAPPWRLNESGRAVILPEFERYYALQETRPGRYEANEYGRDDYLLRNDGPAAAGGLPRFTDVTDKTGLRAAGHGLSATWWDFDGDGWLDLYVANDYDDPDHLYKNMGPDAKGQVRFKDVTAAALPHTPWFSMGTDSADLNNDGRPDFFVVDMAATTHFKDKLHMGDMSVKNRLMEFGEPRQIMRNALYVNTGTWRFQEAAFLAGVARTDWSWSARLSDMDCDGRVDIHVTNGVIRNNRDSDRTRPPSALVGATEWDLYKDLDPLPEQDRAYRNEGDLKFTDVSRDWGLDANGISYSAVQADFDGDGDPDMAVLNLDQPVSLYRNDASAQRVVFRLAAAGANTHGLGTTVTLRAGRLFQARTLMPVAGFTSCHEPLVFFGLGESKKIEDVTVRWPSGRVQTWKELEAGRHYTLTESTAGESKNPGVAPWAGPEVEKPGLEPLSFPAPCSDIAGGLFREAAGFPGSMEEELPYDEFRNEPLLPNRLSYAGPGLACADVDGDGDEDVFIGRSLGKPRSVWFNDGKGNLAPGPPEAFVDQRQPEDAGVLFFEADGDGDADLIVVSGSDEAITGSSSYQNRLYLNDGKGGFTHAPDALPKLTDSGSAVAAADFDRDGDLDLFAGGRSVPGQYPLPATSRLLRNDGGKFSDITAEAAPEFMGTGLVTAAVWTDTDTDGWIDLAVAHEWGPVKIFHNESGQLKDSTAGAGLTQWPGWWLGLTAADLDNDGDMDLVAGNFGLNTKYKASAEKPELLFYGDVDGSGTPQIVEAKYDNDILVPRRGFSCSSTAMPSLKDKLKTYRTFAGSSLEQVYAPERLAAARKFTATTLETGVFLNDGKGRFTFQPLPRAAQLAPVHGLAAMDADADGLPDIVLAQNFWHPQRETGRMAGGTGLLLRGKGDGTFTPLTIAESGVLIPGDARGLMVSDLNRDGLPDFAVAENNGPVRAFLARPQSSRLRTTGVRLSDGKGNPLAIGARVTATAKGCRPQTATVTAGSGWLSQSTTVLYFHFPDTAKELTIAVHWPDGRTTKHREPAGSVTLSRSAKNGKTAK